MSKDTKTDRMERRVRDTIATLEALLVPAQGGRSVLAEFIRRAEMPSEIDGFPRGGSGERVGGGVTGDPTALAAQAREADVCGRCRQGQVVLADGRMVNCRHCGGSGRRWADPVADGVVAIEVAVLHMARQARQIDRHRALIVATVPKAGRGSSLQGNCLVCGAAVTGLGQDRLKRGMDNACYLSWGSWKIKNETSDPGQDFHRFTVWRRQRLADKERQELEAADHERKAKRR